METERRRSGVDGRNCGKGGDQCDDIVRVSSLIYGNGVAGIAHNVEAHERFIQRIKGVFYFLSASNVVIIAKLFWPK
jgi:hypothetical protein